MTSKDNSTNTSNPYTVSERLKKRREMLGISQQKAADDLDISVEEVEHYENLKSPETTTCDTIGTEEPKKYTVEIYREKNDLDKKNHFGARELDLFYFEGINLLFERLESSYNCIVEFCARIKPGEKLYDEFDKVYYEDNNVLEITSIKKVGSNDNT